MLTLLVVSLLVQLRARHYVPWRYWLTVVLVSVVGTQITDFLTDKLDISLYLSTAVFAVAMSRADGSAKHSRAAASPDPRGRRPRDCGRGGGLAGMA